MWLAILLLSFQAFTFQDQAFLGKANLIQRIPITIDNTLNASTLTDYQVSIPVLHRSGMQSTFADIRFSDSDGLTLIKHWLESKTNSTSATFWVKVPTVAASSTKIIYLYYGDPNATDASDFANVFINGSDFSSNYGDLTSQVAGNGANEIVAASTGLNDVRAYRFWSGADTYTIAPSAGYTYVRDIGVVRNTNNCIVVESGVLVGYYAARTVAATDTCDVMRATSSDGGKTWTETGAVLSHGGGGIGDNTVGHCSVLKISPTSYFMVLTVRDVSTNPYKLAYATSTDNSSWTLGTVIADAAKFNTPSPDVGPSVPWIVRLVDGTYIVTMEGKNTSDNKFYCYGMSSSDLSTWTALNSGQPILSPSSAGHFDDLYVANPKLVQIPDGSFVMAWNGGTGAGIDFQVALATASSAGGAYTKYANNPTMGKTTTSYGLETSHLSFDTTGTRPWQMHQEFGPSGDWTTARIFYSEPVLVRGCYRSGSVATDASMFGRVLSTGNLISEALTHEIVSRSTVGDLLLQGFYDYAAVPAVGSSTDYSATGRVRIFRANRARGVGTQGDILIDYFTSAGVQTFWNGSIWTTTTSRVAADDLRPVKSTITDDGSNFVIRAEYADDGSLITQASIAKATVKAFSDGRVVIIGDPFNNTLSGSQLIEYYRTRVYTATPPTVSY